MVEEVRREGGPFPLEIPCRQEEVFRINGTISTDSALPFRPARCDETYRKFARKTPKAPVKEALSRSAPQLGLKTKADFDVGQRSTETNGRRSMRGGSRHTEEFPSMAPIPSAGLRAVVTRRLLSGSIIKRRRRGNADGRGRGGSGGGKSISGGARTVEVGVNAGPGAALATATDPLSSPRRGRRWHSPTSGEVRITDASATAMDTEHTPFDGSPTTNAITATDTSTHADTATGTCSPTHADTAIAIDTPARAPVSNTPAPRQEAAPAPTQDVKISSTRRKDTGEPGGVYAGNKVKSTDDDVKSEGDKMPPPSGKTNAVPSSPTGRPPIMPPGPTTTTAAVREVPASNFPSEPLPPTTTGGDGKRAGASLNASAVPPSPTGDRPITALSPGAATTAMTEMRMSNFGAPLPLATNGNERARARAPWKGNVVPRSSSSGFGRLFTAPSSTTTMPAALKVPGLTSGLTAPVSIATMPAITTSTVATKGPGLSSGGPFHRTAPGGLSTATVVSREKMVTPREQQERGNAPGTLGFDNIYGGGEVDGKVFNGDIARGRNGVAKRISFADKTTADDIVSSCKGGGGERRGEGREGSTVCCVKYRFGSNILSVRIGGVP